MPAEMFMRTSFKQSEAQKLIVNLNPRRRTVVQYLEISSNAWGNETPSGSAAITSFFLARTPKMSLIMGTRFRSGILFAADPFFFDNDGATPTKGTDFEKFIVSERYRCLMTGVGSRWVLKQAGEWIETQDGAFTEFLTDLARKWC